jgi:hypothetical protein
MIPLKLPEIKELSNDEKWDMFDQHVQKHLKFQEDTKPHAFNEDCSQGMEAIQISA